MRQPRRGWDSALPWTKGSGTVQFSRPTRRTPVWIAHRPGRPQVMMDADGVSPAAKTRSRLDLRVRATPGSLAEVRRSLEALAVPPGLLDDAKLLLSELVGNSVRHSGLQADEYVHITAEWSGARLRVVVHDRVHPSAPRPVSGAIRPAPGAESGWGLFIVDRLASRWGTDGAGYWFELDEAEAALR